MWSRLIAPLLITLAMAVDVAGPAAAQNLVDPRQRERGEEHRNQAGGISLDQAVRMAESRYRAKAVRAETVNNGGRRVHEIRLLNSEGKVWKVRIDADTGQSY
jgi:uncharacterized membrane protein YkoI